MYIRNIGTMHRRLFCTRENQTLQKDGAEGGT